MASKSNLKQAPVKKTSRTRAPAKQKLAAKTKAPAKKKLAAKAKASAEQGTSNQPAGAMQQAAEPKLLSGGNPQIPKGDGDTPVQAYLKAMPGWKQHVGRRLDDLIEDTVPGVRKAVRWNSPFYGMPGRGWFLSLHCFNKFVRVTFLNGGSLRPLPPGESKYPAVRYLDIRETDPIDDAVASWIRQASELPGDALF